MDIGPQLTQTISNMATHIVFGSRVDYSSDQLDNLQFTDYLSKRGLLNILPIIKVKWWCITAVSCNTVSAWVGLA